MCNASLPLPEIPAAGRSISTEQCLRAPPPLTVVVISFQLFEVKNMDQTTHNYLLWIIYAKCFHSFTTGSVWREGQVEGKWQLILFDCLYLRWHLMKYGIKIETGKYNIKHSSYMNYLNVNSVTKCQRKKIKLCN